MAQKPVIVTVLINTTDPHVGEDEESVLPYLEVDVCSCFSISKHVFKF